MSLNITITEVFGYAEQIVNALMPVAYVAGGVGLGFLIFGRIVSAFR